jgi:hypothetical protein
MKLVKFTAAAILSLLIFSPYTFSQPKFIAHVGGGLSIPLAELKGDVDVNTVVAPKTDENYLIRLGVNFGADAKYAFDKKGNIRGVFGIGYNLMMNPVDIIGLGTIKYRPVIGILTLSLGPEYAFLPKGKVNPFVGVDFTANFINGSYEYEPQMSPIFTNVTIESASRFGIQFGVGTDFVLGKNIGIVVGVKYNLVNLIGKESDSSKAKGNTRALNDKEYTYTSTTGTVVKVNDKNISYVQMYAGLAFFFGHPKKVVKK